MRSASAFAPRSADSRPANRRCRRASGAPQAARRHACNQGRPVPPGRPTILRKFSKDDRGRLRWPAPRQRNNPPAPRVPVGRRTSWPPHGDNGGCSSLVTTVGQGGRDQRLGVRMATGISAWSPSSPHGSGFEVQPGYLGWNWTPIRLRLRQATRQGRKDLSLSKARSKVPGISFWLTTSKPAPSDDKLRTMQLITALRLRKLIFAPLNVCVRRCFLSSAISVPLRCLPYSFLASDCRTRYSYSERFISRFPREKRPARPSLTFASETVLRRDRFGLGGVCGGVIGGRRDGGSIACVLHGALMPIPVADLG